MKLKNYYKPLAVSCLALAVVPGCARQNGTHPGPEGDVRAEAQVAAPQTAAPAPTPTWARGGDAAIADVVEKVLPSVVSVSSTRMARMQSPMQFFFGGPPIERRQEGLGSGVIVDASGVVVTNNHVVADAEEIQVTTNDGRQFKAKTVGTDPKSDLAVLQLEGEVKGLVPLRMGSSSALRLGDVVLAIGNPFGVGQTVTMGIVSAKGRANMGIVDYEDFIQTDAAINPGNSGGALVNMQGELVGINTAILSRSGGNVGIGFAIPTDMAKPIIEALRTDGRVSRGWLGVAIQDVDADLQRAMNLPVASGVLIADVQPDTPAARAGVQRGDVITHVDGQEVRSSGVFRNRIAAAGADAKVELRLVRQGKEQTVTVTLGELPGEKDARPGAEGKADTGGLSVRPLDAEARQRLGLGDQPRHGVVVERVEPNSAAARARLRPGDVLLEVNRTPVRTPQEFRAAYGKAKGDRLVLVYRQGATFFTVLK
ncbi:MAG: DegQ family serine endoprotease [Myxococcales bacterium]|jgi:serine protease Do|nr:DegQ family serine endoprotease [Myxococcales bacterium]